VIGFKVGERVAYVGSDSQAEYTAVEPLHIAHVPDGIEPGVAAASLIQGLTAITMVKESYAVQKVCHSTHGGGEGEENNDDIGSREITFSSMPQPAGWVSGSANSSTLSEHTPLQLPPPMPNYS